MTIRTMQKSWIPEPNKELRIMGYCGGLKTSPWTFFHPDSSIVSSWSGSRKLQLNAKIYKVNRHEVNFSNIMLAISGSPKSNNSWLFSVPHICSFSILNENKQSGKVLSDMVYLTMSSSLLQLAMSFLKVLIMIILRIPKTRKIKMSYFWLKRYEQKPTTTNFTRFQIKKINKGHQGDHVANSQTCCEFTNFTH